jgi:biopolymer transport protein ExbD
MRRFSDRHSLQTLSELNVTPLLDLAFVLLIIFMITTPLMENSVDLVLPKTDTEAQPTDPNAVQTVSIDKDGLLEFNGAPTTLDQLEADLTALKAEKPDAAVVVRSHRELSIQKVIDILDVVRRVKITKVGVVTSPEN